MEAEVGETFHRFGIEEEKVSVSTLQLTVR